MTESFRPDATEALTTTLRERIMVIDGAMGTAIQRDRPSEEGYRGERFADWPSDLQGNNDLLTLTQPDIIAGIHREYLEAGADILETNTFNANAVSLADYGMEELAHELNLEAARLARRVADEVSHAGPAALRRGRPRPDDPDGVDLARRQRPRCPQRQLRPAGRGVRRGDPRPARGRLDLLFIETIFDTLNAKAAIFAVETVFEELRPALAGHRVRHDHRRLGPHPVRTGDRGVLGLDPAREPDRGRPQLRARRQGDAPLHRRDVADRGLVRLLLPQRRAAQRLR